MKMNKEDVLKMLRDNVVEVTFIKKSTGTERVMNCTLNQYSIPIVHLPKGGYIEKDSHPTVIRVFDIDAQGWRSFDIDTVMGMVASYIK